MSPAVLVKGRLPSVLNRRVFTDVDGVDCCCEQQPIGSCSNVVDCSQHDQVTMTFPPYSLTFIDTLRTTNPSPPPTCLNDPTHVVNVAANGSTSVPMFLQSGCAWNSGGVPAADRQVMYTVDGSQQYMEDGYEPGAGISDILLVGQIGCVPTGQFMPFFPDPRLVIPYAGWKLSPVWWLTVHSSVQDGSGLMLWPGNFCDAVEPPWKVYSSALVCKAAYYLIPDVINDPDPRGTFVMGVFADDLTPSFAFDSSVNSFSPPMSVVVS